MGDQICVKGCGCRCAPKFKTCCRGCATTGVHDRHCLGLPEGGVATSNPFTPHSPPDENPEFSFPAEDAVPGCLLPPRWSNRDIPPIKWGMQCQQFSSFMDACAATRPWDEQVMACGYVNLYALNAELLIPWTRGTGCGIALRMNPLEPLAAELMVSHCWAEDMRECRDALDEFRVQHNISQESVLWFCAFSQYQAGHEDGDVGPTLPEQLTLDPFGSVVRHVSHCLGMVVIHTSKGEIYDRLWCVYEIAEAVRERCKVKVACSLDYVNTGAGNLEAMLRAKTEEAQCRYPNDDEWIRNKITQKLRWQELDRLIFNFRCEALRELTQRHADKLKATILTELKNIQTMPLKEKKESAKVKKESVCLTKPPSSGVAKAAEGEKKQEGVIQRLCSTLTTLFAPPPTLVEAHEEATVSWHGSGNHIGKS